MIPIYPLKAGDDLPDIIAKRSQLNQEAVSATVREILADVQSRGDEALRHYTQKFDNVDIPAENLRVTGDDVNDAYDHVSSEFIGAMKRARDNIIEYHQKQVQNSWLDVQPRRSLGQIVQPIPSAGIYVPGGTAPLFSSVLMNALPAFVAGVERIVMATPPRSDGSICPEMLVTAYECGVKEIYRVGGAQAIAAMAYGTQTIPKVDKIVGPGNIYVSNAKREVFGLVGIDMIAGPSEVLVIADSSANPAWIAADLLSQAEHDTLAASILITDDIDIAESVQAELERQLADLPRQEIAKKSLLENGCILLVDNMLIAIEYANQIAPEHLELCVADPYGLLGWVRNAGACFLGHFTPEPMGDYYAGPSHVLPTSGTAKFSSALSVDDFIKKISVIRYSRSSMLEASQDILTLARAEQLEAHARSVEIRRP